MKYAIAILEKEKEELKQHIEWAEKRGNDSSRAIKMYKDIDNALSLLFGVSRSIGEVKDKFGIVKTSEKKHPNVCELCKYKGQDALSDECNWCLNNHKINQYYG